MQERELVSIIKSHRRNSLGGNDGALSNERALAMDRYHGRPYGNEEEGRSAVVSRDLSETVDWAMPAIMRIFTQSGNIGEFDPVGPEDEELAQQESDAINQVVMKDNDGFILWHDAIKDALLLKNGYVKHYWDVTEKISEEEYKGLTIEQLAAMMGQLESDGAVVEVIGQEERTEVVVTPDGQQTPSQVFDIRLKITRKEGKPLIEAAPCEEIRVSRKCRGALQKSPFTEHVTRKTRSDLIEMGMSRAFVDSLPAYNSDDNDQERLARDSVTDESDDIDVGSLDRSMDEIEFCEAYIRVDWDGDGVAELRKVVTCADRIPPGADWNEVIDAVPVTGGSPKRVPHRHVGESLADELEDLGEIKTVLTRQMLDNLYLTNNNQWAVNERVNLPDFMQSLPGGIKRVRGIEPVNGSFEAIVTQSVLGQVLPALDYIDRVKSGRTGVSETTTGLDPDVLKQSTKGAFIENLNRASQKIEMIARMLAETLVKPAMIQVHALMIKHQDKPKMMRLRGKYVEVNPQEWRERTDLTLKVGLGTGSQEEQREKLMMAGGVQEKTAMLGLVGPTEAYNLASDLYKALGFDMPEKYIIFPDPENPKWQESQQQMQGKKDPLVQAEEVKGQAALAIEQERQRSKPAELNAEIQKTQAEGEIKVRIAEATARIQEETKVRLGLAKIAADKEIAMFEANLRVAEAAAKPAQPQPGFQ